MLQSMAEKGISVCWLIDKPSINRWFWTNNINTMEEKGINSTVAWNVKPFFGQTRTIESGLFFLCVSSVGSYEYGVIQGHLFKTYFI